MSPAGIRKSERVVKSRTGIGHYIPHEDTGSVSEYRLQLDWIPVSLKNRGRSFFNKTLGRVMHYTDKRVVTDQEAIQAIWKRVLAPSGYKPPVCPLRMEMHVTFFRPLSKNESLTGIWNRRRGDLCSAHEIIMDALEDCWYEDDSQVTKVVLEERRDCVVPHVMILGSPR